jgi:hypothetical protein
MKASSTTAAPEAAAPRSLAITALGWLWIALAVVLVPMRAVNAVEAWRLEATAGSEALATLAAASTHPVHAFLVRHLVFVTTSYAVFALALGVLGVGFLRRRRWAPPLGATLALFAVTHALAALSLLFGDAPPALGMEATEAAALRPWLIAFRTAVIAGAALTTAFVRRPPRLAEFQGGQVAAFDN